MKTTDKYSKAQQLYEKCGEERRGVPDRIKDFSCDRSFLTLGMQAA